MRLTPLGPMPRSDTPCVVGLATRLLLRRNRLKPGIWRSRSSTVRAAERSISSLVNTVTLAGTSCSACSTRPAETTTGSRRTGVPGVSTAEAVATARRPSADNHPNRQASTPITASTRTLTVTLDVSIASRLVVTNSGSPQALGRLNVIGMA